MTFARWKANLHKRNKLYCNFFSYTYLILVGWFCYLNCISMVVCCCSVVWCNFFSHTCMFYMSLGWRFKLCLRQHFSLFSQERQPGGSFWNWRGIERNKVQTIVSLLSLYLYYLRNEIAFYASSNFSFVVYEWDRAWMTFETSHSETFSLWNLRSLLWHISFWFERFLL